MTSPSFSRGWRLPNGRARLLIGLLGIPVALGLLYTRPSAQGAASTASCAAIAFSDKDVYQPPPSFQDIYSGQDPADLEVKSYSISATVDASRKGLITAVIRLGKPPKGHSGQGVFYAVEWLTDDHIAHWAGASIDSTEAQTLTGQAHSIVDPLPTPTAQPLPVIAPSVSYATGFWNKGGTATNGESGFIADDTKVVGKISDDEIQLTFPYGQDGGPERTILSSGAQSFIAGVGTATSGWVPVPKWVDGYPRLGQIDMINADTAPSFSGPANPYGPGGSPFCGDGFHVASTVCPAPGPLTADPPADEVTCLPTRLPNWFWDNYPQITNRAVTSQATQLVSDPAHHFILEYNSLITCDGSDKTTPRNAIGYDDHTLELIPGAAVCLAVASAGNGSSAPMNAVDPSGDGVIFMTNRAMDGVMVISEDGLKNLGTVLIPSVPAGHTPQIMGISWSAANHQLLMVVADKLEASGVNRTTAVRVLSMGVAIHDGALTATENWDQSLSQCADALSGHYAAGNPYMSVIRSAVFVPCARQSSTQERQPREAMVRIDLADGAQGGVCASGAPAAVSCPKSVTLSPPAPDATVGTQRPNYVFDPGMDRGYLIYDEPVGITIDVYDPGTNAFTGRSAVGVQVDADYMAFGFDANSGRLYGIGPTAGLSMVEGRMTRLNPPQQQQDLASNVALDLLPVLPADATYEYPRVLVPYSVGNPDPNFCKASCSLPSFELLADRRAPASDPLADPGSVDLLTWNGQISPTDVTYSTYTANARGYGVHSDFVGSYGSALANLGVTTMGGSLPLGAGNRDLLAASVDQLNISNGWLTGNASALRPADSGTAPSVLTCTDVGSVQTCLPPPPASPPNRPNCVPPEASPSPAEPSPQASPVACSPSPPATGQLWPAREATCDSGHPSADAGGLYLTGQAPSPSPGSDGAGSTGQALIPGSDSFARARVDCGATDPVSGSAIGQALLHGLGLDSGRDGLPSVEIGRAFAITSVAPPASNRGPLSRVSATAQGIDIGLPDGTRLSIGYVNHLVSATANGRPGGAGATNIVQLGNIVITTPGKGPFDPPTVQQVCVDVDGGATPGGHLRDECPDNQKAIDAINGSALGANVHVSLPHPYDPFDPSGKPNFGAPAGSPGGYQATIQADQPEQFADQQFNGMSREESSYLPALRIEVLNDGSNGLSRQVLDLAGVQVDAQLGVQDFGPPWVAPSPSSTPQPSPTPRPAPKASPHPSPSSAPPAPGPTPSAEPPHCVYAGASPSASLNTFSSSQSKAAPSSAAGPSPMPSPSPSADACHKEIHIPGSKGAPGTKGSPRRPPTPAQHHRVQQPGHRLNYNLASAKSALAGAAGHLGNTLGGLPGANVIERFFNGFGIVLGKHLAAILELFAFLLVLASPLLLMMRRQLWLGSMTRESQSETKGGSRA